MEIERALPDPPSELSRRLRLVAAREHGVGAEQLRWIGTDPDLFEAFYREHVDDLQRFVARRVGDRERAADLTAEIFLAAIGSAHRYRPRRGTPKAWLYGIARILVANDRRRRGRERAREERLRGSVLLDSEDAARIDARIDAAAQARRLYAAMDRLPEAERRRWKFVAIQSAGGCRGRCRCWCATRTAACDYRRHEPHPVRCAGSSGTSRDPGGPIVIQKQSPGDDFEGRLLDSKAGRPSERGDVHARWKPRMLQLPSRPGAGAARAWRLAAASPLPPSRLR